ncbi:MAG: hypothetical protein KKB37_02780 [Alphaproteobacteria bacterium]|nr:hypothetical protein [Alphaproteobacteria bacterium]
MLKITTIGLAAIFGLTAITAANAQNPTAQAYKSPDDCIADYGRLDTDNDGTVDNNESSRYIFIREGVDVDADGNISAEERRVACEKGLAKPFLNTN